MAERQPGIAVVSFGDGHKMKMQSHGKLVVAALAASCTLAGGCVDAVADAVAAGALDLIQGAVTGVAGTAVFGESPPPLILNSVLNAIGGGGGGGGGGGHH
jgi:hypothetical protein